MNTTIKQCRTNLRLLDRRIRNADAEVKRLTRLRHRTKINLCKAEAREFVNNNKQYIGKWIAADAPKTGKWSGAKIYLKPTKFIYEAGLDCVRVYAVGIIAFRYTRPNCHHGWQLAGDRDRVGKICVFGSEYGVTMRPASDKDLSRNHTLICNSEKTARQLWGIK